MDLSWYGQFAQSTTRPQIQTALADIRSRVFVYAGWPSYQGRLLAFESGPVGVYFNGQAPAPGDPRLSGTDVARVVQAIADLFFKYNDPPREFGAEIMIRRKRSVTLLLDCLGQDRTWPALPFGWRVKQDMVLGFYLYGKHVEDAPGAKIAVYRALMSIHDGIKFEGSQSGVISRKSYTYAPVKLEIQSRDPRNVEITRDQMTSVLITIGALFYGNGPRDFAAFLDVRKGNVAKIFLTIEDSDSTAIARLV
ncbi:MAG: hypothetical protein Q9220_000763 [cf. Caloplaca sp. 1 TL-2023]